MNRNTEAHFAQVPTIDISRSKFDRSFNHKTTFNAGDIIPFFCTDVLPGDTMKMNTSHIVRMMTPITPVMDNANMDTYFFFVPNRLIWEHWQEFMGENKTAPWTQQVQYSEPQIQAPASTGWTKGSLADYFGYPTGIASYKASALPFRAYCQIYNDWFRSENLKNPCNIYTGDSDTVGVDILDANYDYVTDTVKGAAPCKAAKLFDYFTSALPSPQKGPSVQVPLGDSAPLVIGKPEKNYSTYTHPTTFDGKPAMYCQDNTGLEEGGMYTLNSSNAASKLSSGSYGLYTDLSEAVGATVNQLRQAFQIQKFYERQARGGTRYIELLRSHFKTTNPDFRMQRAEYLGGMRTPININQVVQTNATQEQLGGEYQSGNWVWSMSDVTPQGNTAAYSLTSGRNKDLFTHSFTEHGWVIGLCVIRQTRTYQQGLNRMFSRKSMFDYYWPELANLGEQSILNKEIYLQGTSKDEEAFGYQERYAEYRYMPDIVTGEMRSNYSASLDIWHWADDYNALPTLGSDWIDEDKTNIQRTLAVQNHDQFFGDFWFNCIMTRPMPMFSVPGLIDHH